MKLLQWSRLERLIAEVRWRWLHLTMRIRSHLRLERGEVVGFLSASPNPASSSAGTPDFSSVTLGWTAATSAVEVRLGEPDGPLISRTSYSGETKTGEWVADGTTFYLQNFAGDLPLTLENTLDVVRIAVKG